VWECVCVYVFCACDVYVVVWVCCVMCGVGFVCGMCVRVMYVCVLWCVPPVYDVICNV
jgi:hypothetical protein